MNDLCFNQSATNPLISIIFHCNSLLLTFDNLSLHFHRQMICTNITIDLLILQQYTRTYLSTQAENVLSQTTIIENIQLGYHGQVNIDTTMNVNRN